MADSGSQKKPNSRLKSRAGGARQAAGGAAPETHSTSSDQQTAMLPAFPKALQLGVLPPVRLTAAGAAAMMQAEAKTDTAAAAVAVAADAAAPTGSIANPVFVDPDPDPLDPRPFSFLVATGRATGRFGDPGQLTRPAGPPPEERPPKRMKNITDQEEANLFLLRHETDLAIQHAAQYHPEVVQEAVALRDKGLLTDAKNVAESGVSAMQLLGGISPKGYVVAGAVEQLRQNSPKESKSPVSGVAGCKCFACLKDADVEISGWWATEFEARLKHTKTRAELRITGWLCGGCRWGCRSKAQSELGRWGWWASRESRALEIEWLTDSIAISTGSEWRILFIWVEQQ